MGLYLYCITDSGATAPADLAGIDGAAVEVHDVAGTAAWVSELDAVPPPSLERARSHHEVIAAAAERAAAVPIRYGQLLADEAALEHQIRARAGFSAERERVRGRVEMGVRIEVVTAAGEHAAVAGGAVGGTRKGEAAEAAGGAPVAEVAAEGAVGPGAAYLRGVAEHLHREDALFADAEAVADAVAAAVAELSEDAVRQRERQPPAIVMAHLVQRRSATDFAVRARAAAEVRPGARLFVTGPWPAYSFVT